VPGRLLAALVAGTDASVNVLEKDLVSRASTGFAAEVADAGKAARGHMP
jgi:hypothetical protein